MIMIIVTIIRIRMIQKRKTNKRNNDNIMI